MGGWATENMYLFCGISVYFKYSFQYISIIT
jgi:hypothetical protein